MVPATPSHHHTYREGLSMPHYVDGFILPVPENKIDDYLRTAGEAAKIWREHGALEVRECVADDVAVGEITSFPRSVQVEQGETVVFAWILYESREHRDRVVADVMKDPRFTEMMTPEAMPVDGKRMIFGGFSVAVEA
jgi:uncharacterized protein YbaA (DUF1428 family)